MVTLGQQHLEQFPKVFPNFQVFLKFLLLTDAEKHSQNARMPWQCGSTGDVCVSVSEGELKRSGWDLCVQPQAVLRRKCDPAALSWASLCWRFERCPEKGP